MKIENKTVLVTGGGSGIGKALIKVLVEMEVTNMAVMGRTKHKLEQVERQFPAANFITIQGDVSEIKDIKRARTLIGEKWGRLDILVNNAGVVSAGLLENISDEDIFNQVDINLTGLILMTKYFLPLIKESEEGAIINISSGLGYVGMPFYSVYAAAKAGVKHFSEAMRRELGQYPIHVMTVFPTATDTHMMKTARVNNMDTPETVARATIDGLINDKIEVVLGGDQQYDLIRMNKEHPEEVDKKIQDQFDTLRNRTKEHRSM